jgi:hypothetical protein
MNTPTENTTDTTTRPHRPGFWLRAIEHRKHALAHEYRTGLGEKARAGVSDEDYATTMATLETMARNLGWTEDDEQGFGPRFGGRRGFGPGFAPQFGPGFGPHRGHGRGHGRPGRPTRETSPENSPESSRATDTEA